MLCVFASCYPSLGLSWSFHSNCHYPLLLHSDITCHGIVGQVILAGPFQLDILWF